MTSGMLPCALLLLAFASTPTAAEPVDLQQRVDAVLAERGLSTEKRTERLVEIGSKATPYLCTLLAEQRDAVPVAPIAVALGRIGQARAVDALVDLLASDDGRHRESAAVALGETGAAEALVPLLVALGDADAGVRRAAYPSVVRLATGKHQYATVRELAAAVEESEHKDGFALALAHLDGKDARAALVGLLSSRSEGVVLAALAGLWAVPREEDGPAIHDVLYLTSSKGVSKKACLLLGRLRYAPATRDLIDLLYESDEGLVKNAHWALTQITGHRIVADTELWETWWERVGSQEAESIGGDEAAD